MSFFIQQGILALVLIGEGSRRVCYRLAQSDVNAKFYRPSADSRWQRFSARLHTWIARFVSLTDVNICEWRYYQRLGRRLPADLFAIFPEQIEPVYSCRYGWGLLETTLRNADGSCSKSVHKEMAHVADPIMRFRIYREVEHLLRRLAENDVRFYDFHNLLLQWMEDGAFRLRVADFEPCGRGLQAGLLMIPAYSRWKMRRRTERYLARLRGILSACNDGAGHPLRQGKTCGHGCSGAKPVGV